MNFLNTIKERAKKALKTIVLPESADERTLKAAEIILDESIANVILIGDADEIGKKGYNLSKATIINPKNYEKSEYLAEKLYELRKSKGLTLEEAQKLVQNELFLGVMMVDSGIADGMVAGAANSTANVLRPSLQILKTAPGTKLVSSFFIMDIVGKGVYLFSDCGLNQNPNAEELAYIALSSAESFKTLVQDKPVVAMLSHSTKGSAKHADVDKVVSATKLAQELAKEDTIIDGEFQLDAAINPTVAAKKAPGAKIQGNANVLVFPDLDSGNIGYKLVENFAYASAFGPITQGIKKPINDLSRSCSFEDIVGVVAITAVQCQSI